MSIYFANKNGSWYLIIGWNERYLGDMNEKKRYGVFTINYNLSEKKIEKPLPYERKIS